jgi:hypothetical protein
MLSGVPEEAVVEDPPDPQPARIAATAIRQAKAKVNRPSRIVAMLLRGVIGCPLPDRRAQGET